MSVRPRLESYIFAPAGGSLIDASATLAITESAASLECQLSATMTITDALAAWQATANASAVLSGLYAFSYDDAAAAVTLSSDTAFDVTFRGNQAALLGFTAATLTGASTYTSDQHPAGIYQPLALDYDVPAVRQDGKLLEFRGGRALAPFWHQAAGFQVRIKDTTAEIRRQLAGPVLRGGRVLIAPTTDRAALYGASNLGGYFAADIHAIDSVRTIGQAEALAEITATCSTAQALA